ncbi:MAG: inositol monophosphatase family protein [Bdellovibrionales bacterium]
MAQKNGQIIWTEVLKKALAVVREGRFSLLGYLGQLEKVEVKLQAGLVSEADRETELLIKRGLQSIASDWEFLGEEESFLNGDKIPAPSGHPRWILDPLDGTTNYIHRFPIFCISLALEFEGELQLAIIDCLVTQETFTAIRGQGAYRNGKAIHVSQTSNLKDSLLATGFFPDNIEALKEQVRVFSYLVERTRGIRRAGAAAYDLCMVAQGTFDGFWEPNLKPWDVAAGQLLVEEAGGVVLNRQGNRHNPYDNYIIATNSKLSQTLGELIRSQSKC